jgi:hypothetical protein
LFEVIDVVKFTFALVCLSCSRLDVYIHDYLLKRKLHASAKAFMTEGKVASDPVGMLLANSCQSPGLIFHELFGCLMC